MMHNPMTVFLTVAIATIVPSLWLGCVGIRCHRLALYAPPAAILLAIAIASLVAGSHIYWLPIVVLNMWIPQFLAASVLRHHMRRSESLTSHITADFSNSMWGAGK